jgi:hypothetical protein
MQAPVRALQPDGRAQQNGSPRSKTPAAGQVQRRVRRRPSLPGRIATVVPSVFFLTRVGGQGMIQTSIPLNQGFI